AGRWCGRPGLHDFLNVGEAHPEVVELANPTNSNDSGRIVKPKTALRSTVGLEKPEFFVMVDRAYSLAARPRQVPNLEQLVGGSLTQRCHRMGGSIFIANQRKSDDHIGCFPKRVIDSSVGFQRLRHVELQPLRMRMS